MSDLSDGGFAHHTIRARNLEDVARPRQNKSAPKRATHVGLDTSQRCHESCGRRGATHYPYDGRFYERDFWNVVGGRAFKLVGCTLLRAWQYLGCKGSNHQLLESLDSGRAGLPFAVRKTGLGINGDRALGASQNFRAPFASFCEELGAAFRRVAAETRPVWLL